MPPLTYSVHTLLQNGHSLSGHSWDLAAGGYSLEPQWPFDERYENYKPIEDLVGFDCLNMFWYYYYNDFTCNCAGYIKSYTLPGNKEPSNIVGIGVSTKGYTYFWFDDNTVSYKRISTWNTRKYYLAKKTRPLESGEPPNYEPSDVVGMAISPDYCYAWYKDGYVSYGLSRDLDWKHAARTVKIPLILDAATIEQLFRNALGNRVDGNTQFILTRNAFKCPESDPLKAILRREKVARENWEMEEERKFGPGMLVKTAMLREVYEKNLHPYHYATALLFGDDIEESLYIVVLNYDYEFWVIDPKTSKVDTNSSIEQSIPDSVRFTKIII